MLNCSPESKESLTLASILAPRNAAKELTSLPEPNAR